LLPPGISLPSRCILKLTFSRDWNLIPGITVDYGATPLTCGTAQQHGLETFVGGVSDGDTGIGVMRYLNPVTQSLQFQKTWFFLSGDVQHIMVANVSSLNTSAPVYSVLDQKRKSGKVSLGGGSIHIGADAQAQATLSLSGIQSLWHDNVGYALSTDTTLTVQTGVKTGNWSLLGISKQPPASVDLFAAWITHNPNSLGTPVEYTAYPGISEAKFNKQIKKPSFVSVRNDASVSAVYDTTKNVAMAVFWDAAAGGNVTFQSLPGHGSSFAPITVSANANAAVMYDLAGGIVTVSDPSQTLQTVEIGLALGKGGKVPPHWTGGRGEKTLVVSLPQSGEAGSSVVKSITDV
jgi:hypothetical protein